MNKIDIKVNKSKIYFTPLFNEVVPISYFRLLKNTYFWYDDFGEEVFCLLYKFDGKVKGTHNLRSGFTVYEQTVLMRNELYEGHKDYDDFVIYKFKLTDDLLEYRDLLLEGKYSKHFITSISFVILGIFTLFIFQAVSKEKFFVFDKQYKK